MTLRRNRRPFTTRVGTVSLLAVGLSPLLLASPANAADGRATAAVVGNGGHHYGLRYSVGAGEQSTVNVTLQEAADHSVFTYTLDDVLEIDAGPYCAYPDPADLTKVTCELENFLGDDRVANDPEGVLSLDDGNDSVTFTNLTTYDFSSINLGSGDNTYTAARPGAPDAYVSSEAGQDTITLGTGGFTSSGGGNDDIRLIGGAATVYASAGADEVQGGTGNDDLDGGPGDDLIYGNDGNDHITGAQDNDTLYGGRGDDVIYGNSGDDVIYGNSGNDVISGGPGTDTIAGGPGNNTITD
ncbi:hypothetical protein [Kineosporia sp. NBRC 101731]|uniref:calcium-binding protein n=1 Tax=Kineosporia sp. NBRC 101731 TaxID=3032199 RepID=UPI0024A15162|nr:hypothetical protein [Kineosporia sp. NBRC 101731]GLY28483.1 hypothetical protein Kisp02_18480 [Kineosporia sp. NBRC 101731]